ncbi:hypothetical protein BWI97_02595 [Siphonobacter sp. BAB-5405]|uniref:site-specific integrase n=1 Tax=Siphonobacter sp. BAB-5405 TaxID=1864825 RepID=UPI000C80D1E3|nr:site-specific integrase [Siphonobacter sp. BAB-5405]PMD99304.1 hypothetical protein BWI97_02595 [Siphonobacter sp. BAB-5405]
MATTVKFYLNSDQPLQNGELPIYVRLTKDRKHKYIALSAKSCTKDQWDEKLCLPKKNHPHHKELTIAITQLRLHIQKTILNYENEGREYSLEELKLAAFSDRTKRSITVYNYFEDTIRTQLQSARVGNSNVIRSTYNKLKIFRKGKDLEFSDITTQFVKRYEDYLQAEGNKSNTVFLYLRTFKTVLNYAKEDGFVKPDYNPFKNIDFAKYRRVKTKKRALPKETMDKIKALDLSKQPSLQFARHIFLFSYYAWGINFSDIAFLKWKDIIDDSIYYIRRKTHESLNVGLSPELVTILDVYKKSILNENEESYIFPILNKRKHLTPIQIDNRIDKVLKNVNRDLKIIGEMVESALPISTYTARHSFASVLKKSGVSTAIIKEMMGHDTERTTEIYLDSFENEQLNSIAKNYL